MRFLTIWQKAGRTAGPPERNSNMTLPSAPSTPASVADTVWKDDVFGSTVLEEPEVWGIVGLGPDGLVVRLVVKTVPLEQWKVARELRQRLKSAFDEAGVDIAVPRTVVQSSSGTVAVPLPASPDGEA